MFILTTIVDTVRIPANMLALPTLTALHNELDVKYPNRVLMDIGLVISRHGRCLKITNGSCVPGDGGCHHECLFRLLVFRPFVEEVCIGRIVKSSANGIQVTVGFFQDIFIPAYWMLRPSHYDEKVGLWVWQPNYDEEQPEDTDTETKDGENDEAKDATEEAKDGENNENPDKDDNGEDSKTPAIKQDDEAGVAADEVKSSVEVGNDAASAADADESDRFEMEIGAEIRFKVKSIHFTQVTNTAKGVQATTTTTAHSQTLPPNSTGKEEDDKSLAKPLRKRSISVDMSEASAMPATMKIVASICEDGLGCTSWWISQEDDDEEEEEVDDENGGEKADENGEA